MLLPFLEAYFLKAPRHIKSVILSAIYPSYLAVRLYEILRSFFGIGSDFGTSHCHRNQALPEFYGRGDASTEADYGGYLPLWELQVDFVGKLEDRVIISKCTITECHSIRQFNRIEEGWRC